MTIIQPRLENISTYECSVEELLDWAETYVRPRAKLAFEGKGEQVPGDWCRFCRARTSCKACAEEALALVKEEFLDLDEGVLTDEAEETARVFDLLLGDNLAGRKDYIAENGHLYLDMIDVS